MSESPTHYSCIRINQLAQMKSMLCIQFNGPQYYRVEFDGVLGKNKHKPGGIVNVALTFADILMAEALSMGLVCPAGRAAFPDSLCACGGCCCCCCAAPTGLQRCA